MEQPQDPEKAVKPLRIIYIEDQEKFAGSVRESLEKQKGFKLLKHFSSVEDAEKYLDDPNKADMPDVIVTDNNLGAGKKTGLQFAKEQLGKRPKIAIILVSGRGSTTDSLMKFPPEKLRNGYGLAGVLDKDVVSEQKDALINLIKRVTLKAPPQA